MLPRPIQFFLLLLLGGCATSSPPKTISSIGNPEFQSWVRNAYSKPQSSFEAYQFYAASKGDSQAMEALFYHALYDARNPLLGGADEVARIWTIEAVLASVGEDKFLSVLEGLYPEAQKAVLAPLDKRVLKDDFSKVSKLRSKFF